MSHPRWPQYLLAAILLPCAAVAQLEPAAEPNPPDAMEGAEVPGAGVEVPPPQDLPAAENIAVEGGSLEILPDTVSPDGQFALGIRTDARTKGLSLQLARLGDKKVVWHSNPKGGLDDPFRYRLRAHGFRDMQYAWSPDSQTLALATATSRGAWIYLLRRGEDAFTSSVLQEAGNAELFTEHQPLDDPELGGVRKLYMNLVFAGKQTLEVVTEGFFFAKPPEAPAPRQYYYEALVRYALDPGAERRIPKRDVRVVPMEQLDRELAEPAAAVE